MKMFIKNPMTVALLLVCTTGLTIHAAPSGHAAETNAIHSVFILPSKPSQGRDPFYPDSNRPYEAAVQAHPQVADVSSLVVRGFSGTMHDRLVIINNHTFAVGDEGDVVTSNGRIHLRCVSIGGNSVVIQVGGQRHTLFYADAP